MDLGSVSEFRKEEFFSMKCKMIENGINCLYHFTDENNLNNIKEKGLCPRNKLSQNEFKSGGNDWSISSDNNLGLNEYVHLCLFKNHPMKYRLEKDSPERNFHWLAINLSVLDFENVKYTDDVSNKSGVRLLSENEAIRCYDFGAFSRLDFRIDENQQRRSKVEKYEILVPCVIPFYMIRIL